MERETKIKIIGTGIFIILLLSVAYLVYHSNKIEKNETIESVKINGNKLLSENDYLNFARLSDLSNNKFSLPVIKSRFEKHPYVLKADAKFINEKEVKVFITEKKIYGVIIQGSEAFFVAENFQLLPVFQNTKMFDFPVLSNIDKGSDLKSLRKIKSINILQAFKIIDASKLISTKILKDLAGINLRNGGDVVLTFSGLSIPVIFGRNYEAEKMVALEALLNNYSINNNLLAESDYIDLRFYNDIYIGSIQRVEM
ncbi:MAG: hypothetical protein A2V93_10650 [Ignavibacteria bacterium RBG_16_34_14]|nr:MAG: hypothetical protein A2V93_10650 [Ignavibacteria bacterium RBG_16_34_14]